MALMLSSPAFAAGGDIPKPFTCDGDNLSPHLVWSGAPAGVQSFALIMDDPDAPKGTFTHALGIEADAKLVEHIFVGANEHELRPLLIEKLRRIHRHESAPRKPRAQMVRQFGLRL